MPHPFILSRERTCHPPTRPTDVRYRLSMVAPALGLLLAGLTLAQPGVTALADGNPTPTPVDPDGEGNPGRT